MGQHTYTVSERQGNTAGITYDPTVYTVTVQVTDEGDRTIGAFITGIKGPDQTEGSEIRFHNIYTPDTPDSPTGPTLRILHQEEEAAEAEAPQGAEDISRLQEDRESQRILRRNPYRWLPFLIYPR